MLSLLQLFADGSLLNTYVTFPLRRLPVLRQKCSVIRDDMDYYHTTWKFAVAWLIGGMRVGLPSKINVYDVLSAGRRKVRLPVVPADPAAKSRGNLPEIESTSGGLVAPPACKRT